YVKNTCMRNRKTPQLGVHSPILRRYTIPQYRVDDNALFPRTPRSARTIVRKNAAFPHERRVRENASHLNQYARRQRVSYPVAGSPPFPDHHGQNRVPHPTRTPGSPVVATSVVVCALYYTFASPPLSPCRLCADFPLAQAIL